MRRGEITKKVSEIRDEKVIKRWLKGTSNNTQRIYLNSLALFCIITGKSPQEMLDIAWKEYEERVPPWKQQLEAWFEDLEEHLEETTTYKNTANTKRAGVVNFFRFHRIPTPDNYRRSRGNTKFDSNNERPPLTKQDIRDALNAAKNFKLKALILTQATSGLSEVDVLKLTVQQFYEGLIKLDDKHEICRIYQKRTKTKRHSKENYTFISFEAVDLIKKYLELERNKPIEGPLFASHPNGNVQYGVGAYSTATIRLNEILSWTTEKGKYNKLTTHMLRKFFETQLTDAGCIQEHLTHMMGWKLPGMRANYYIAHPEELQKSYLKHLDYLTLENVETLTIESPEYKELKELYANDSKAKEEEIKVLKADQQLTRKLVEQLINDLKAEE